MLLLVGLGNPGPSHARQRHNVGFLALDAIAARHGFAPFKARSRLFGEIAEGALGGVKTLLLKPMTYMNDSGRAVGAAVRYYKIALAELVVVHDELDLAPGKLRIKTGGGAAGHNGLRSLDAHIGKDYRRVRIGIGHPGDRDRVTPYVLDNFSAAETAWLKPLLAATADAAPRLAADEDNAFMSEVARLAPPPASGPEEDNSTEEPDSEDGDGT
jgi:peptidyl-tRNA hydrolase, PTH1 family